MAIAGVFNNKYLVGKNISDYAPLIGRLGSQINTESNEDNK